MPIIDYTQVVPKRFIRNINLVIDLFVLCLQKSWTVVILNTCTRFSNLPSANSDVCNGLIY